MTGQKFAQLLPLGAQPMFRWDVFGHHIYEASLTDSLRAELRRTLSRARLRVSYVQLCTRWQSGRVNAQQGRSWQWMAADFMRVVRGVPCTATLCNVVLLVFQQTEMPRVMPEIQVACSRFGVVHGIDSSSAPLQEVRE